MNCTSSPAVGRVPSVRRLDAALEFAGGEGKTPGCLRIAVPYFQSITASKPAVPALRADPKRRQAGALQSASGARSQYRPRMRPRRVVGEPTPGGRMASGADTPRRATLTAANTRTLTAA